MDNEQGYAEAYKDVIHEDAIKIGGATKAPDYCFRIGGARKFFVETKKPAVDLSKDPAPAYQRQEFALAARPEVVIERREKLKILYSRAMEALKAPESRRVETLTRIDAMTTIAN